MRVVFDEDVLGHTSLATEIERDFVAFLQVIFNEVEILGWVVPVFLFVIYYLVEDCG